VSVVVRHVYWGCTCCGGLLLRAHVSVEGARCGGLVLGRRVVVGLYWEDVLWWGCVWACIGKTCCGGVVVRGCGESKEVVRAGESGEVVVGVERL
jgi:hypothetical protein